MFNYGTGSSYNFGGYAMGQGYGGGQMYYPTAPRSNCSMILVLFIVLVLLGQVLGC